LFNLSKYLIAHKDKHILRASVYLISLLIISLALWLWPWLGKTLSLQQGHKVLLQLLAIMVLSVIIMYSYIRFIYNEMSLGKLLENYIHDEKYGYLINQNNKRPYCTNCLYEHFREVQVAKVKDKFKCPIKSCSQIYPIEHTEAACFGMDPPDPQKNRFFNRRRDLGF